MKKFLLVALCLCLGMLSANATTVNYTADNTTIFTNPERGFLNQVSRHANKSKYAVKINTYALNNLAADKGTLILTLYYLDEFRNSATLPDSILDAFDEDMAILRSRGMKAIVRIAYAETRDGEEAPDAPLSIIEKHLAQYKSHWEANADVIYCFQAGFVGQYGEWYYTGNFTYHVESINQVERDLLDTVLNAIPQNRTLLLRRPMFKMQYLDGVALTSEEAFTGTKKARLGHFNDAFLFNADNMGTYSSNETTRNAQKAFIAQETQYVPLGGETDITDADQAATQASYAATTAEMSTMHWTFIKSTYSETVTNMWRENGTFDSLNLYLGYRYQLVNGTYGEAVTAGNTLSVNMQIKNVGYAPLYNERHAYIVLKNNNATYAFQLAADPRRWLPNGATATINETVTVPDTAYNGTYDLYLWLPDAYESLRDDPRYSIRFANAEVWDAETGMNALGAQVVVSGGEEAPEPVDISVKLPATLNKANHSAVSIEKWYNTDYFNFGEAWGVDDSDGHNLSRWIEWEVNLVYPGIYIISEAGYYPNGHNYTLQLLDGETEKSTYTTEQSYSEGDITIMQTTKWDLKDVPAGKYTLRVKNATDYGKPKLKSLTLEYDGELPTGVEQTNTNAISTQAYDILGRPLDESYHGIVIQNGQKRIQ